MLKPIYIKCFLSTAILLGGSTPAYAQMAGISSKSAPPTSKSKSTNGKKPPTGQSPDGVRQDQPQRDPNDDSYSAGALYSPYPNAEKQNAVKQAAKSGLFGKLQQGTSKTAGSPTQNVMPPTAPPLGSTPSSSQQVALPQTTPTAGSVAQQKTGTPQTPAQAGSNTLTQPQGTTPETPVAGSPSTPSGKAPGATIPAKGATTKSASKKDPTNKMQATTTQKTAPGSATTPDVSKSAPGSANTPSQPTATAPPGPPTMTPPQGAQTPYAGQPYPPQFQPYPPQAYPGQYPYNPQYRPQYQTYPYQTQPGYPGYPTGAPPYQTGYPSGYPGNPTTAPTTQQPGYPATQPGYPAGAAEPFSTMKRRAPAQATPQNYSGYPAQQPQYPAQQAYPPQWQQRPYYPPQQYSGQQFPGQQYYQQPPPQNYPTAQPPQNAAPMQQQQAPPAPGTQPQTVQQPPAAQQQPPAAQPPSSAQSNPPEKEPATATSPDNPQTASTGGSSAPAGDNMTEFLAKVTAARQMISTGNPAFAVDSLDQAVKLRPRNLSVYFYRGLAYDEAGDPSTAVKNYLESVDRAKTVGMDSAELRTNLGNSYMKLNFFDDAIVEYQRAIEIEPASGTAHMQLGRALLSKGDYPAALKSLRKCETLGINDPTVSYLKALCFAAMKQKQEALTELAPLLTPASASKNPQLNKLAEDLKGDLK